MIWKTDYEAADISKVRVLPVHVGGLEVPPASVDVAMPLLIGWKERFPNLFANAIEPLFGKYLQKRLDVDGLAESNLGLLGEAPYQLVIELPELSETQWSANIAYINEAGEPVQVYAADGADLENGGRGETIIPRAGDFLISVEGRLIAKEKNGPSGIFVYTASFSVKNPDPVFSVGKTELAQGDILSLILEKVPDDITPELETDLGPAVFTRGVPLSPGADAAGAAVDSGSPDGFSSWYAVTPVSNSCEEGEYAVTVRAGELVFETSVTVVEYEFGFQNLIIDLNAPSNAAATTEEAGLELREKITPLWKLFTEERYWDGLFIMPVDLVNRGFVSTPFGEQRIVNGNYDRQRSHLGMDLAVPKHSPVYASNAGKVLFAEFLLTLGNTVLIDHGGGLKSIYYHMETIETEEGKIVGRGELVGTVGSTGYSTGPHLHFEMRIGEQPVSPSMALEPNAGLYSASIK